jgi:hypothetical protein
VGGFRAGPGVFPDIAFRQDFCTHKERVYAARPRASVER